MSHTGVRVLNWGPKFNSSFPVLDIEFIADIMVVKLQSGAANVPISDAIASAVLEELLRSVTLSGTPREEQPSGLQPSSNTPTRRLLTT